MLTIIAFFGDSLGDAVNQWRFQTYGILVFIFVYTTISRFFGYAGVSLLLLLINFFVISSSVNIISLERNAEGSRVLRVSYQKSPVALIDSFEDVQANNVDIVAINNPKSTNITVSDFLPTPYKVLNENDIQKSFIASRGKTYSTGRVRISSETDAAFTTIEAADSPLTILSIDFSTVPVQQLSEAFDVLEGFVSSRNEPVIIIGDFNTVVWSGVFGEFLDNSGLHAVNPLLSSAKNILFPPTFYVLGYKNLQFINLLSLPARDNKYSPYVLDIKI